LKIERQGRFFAAENTVQRHALSSGVLGNTVLGTAKVRTYVGECPCYLANTGRASRPNSYTELM
jgi:hypothetical protein